VQVADAVVLALRFSVLKDVVDEIADALGDKSVVVPSNPVGIDAQGEVVRLLPEGQSSGEVVSGWLPSGGCLAMAFGTMSANLFESSSNRSPELAVLFYVTDDDRGSDEVERLIRTAGFEPMRVGGLKQSGRLEVGWDLHDLVVGPTEARLGYNPIQHLVGPQVLSQLPPSQRAVLTGRSFFPRSAEA
jgi:predicted dinucleotide-binding enzyme